MIGQIDRGKRAEEADNAPKTDAIFIEREKCAIRGVCDTRTRVRASVQ